MFSIGYIISGIWPDNVSNEGIHMHIYLKGRPQYVTVNEKINSLQQVALYYQMVAYENQNVVIV